VKLLKIIDWAPKLSSNSISIDSGLNFQRHETLFILNMNVESCRGIGKRLHGYNKFQRYRIRLKESMKLLWAAQRTQSL